MTQSDKVNRQKSVESGLSQAMVPMIFCGTEKSISVKPKVPEALEVPQGGESRMAKMKKKISSPLVKKKPFFAEDSNKIFGCPLVDLLKRDQADVPGVVVKIIRYIESRGMDHEGLFRVSGNHRTLENLKAKFDRDGDANLEEADVVTTAGLLKLYLRDLPEPLIPQKLNNDFMTIDKTYGTDNSCLQEIRRLLEKLPEPNYQLIKYLCRFLFKVSQNEGNNKMSATSLAIVFGPNLFRCDDGLAGLQQQGHTNAIVGKFIQEYKALFKIDHEVSPYATTEIFVQEARFDSSRIPRTSSGVSSKSVHESSTSDDDSAHVTVTKGNAIEPIYATVQKKPGTNPHPPPCVSSSPEELDMYIRSVSPCMNQSGGLLQKTIKESIKEHLFGPASTDENSPHSQESGEDAPPVPARRYEDEYIARQKRRRRKNAKNQKEESAEGPETPLSVKSRVQDMSRRHSDVIEQDGELAPKPTKKRPKSEAFERFEKEGIVIGLDKNCNNILSTSQGSGKFLVEIPGTANQMEPDSRGQSRDASPEDDEFGVSRNSGLLSSLTAGRAPPPKNRRKPSHDKRHQLGSKDLAKSFVHPLVEQAKRSDVVSSPPPKSPRSARRTPPSPKSPRRETGIDEVDMAPLPSPLTAQYKKRHHPLQVVPPLELYKLQQGEAEDVRLSPREKYDRFSKMDEATLSPRSRPLSVDTKSFTHPTECPPSPPHEQVDHQWFERRDSPKSEVTVKQLTKTISQLKRKVRDFDDEFEEANGRRPSQSEKAPIKKYVSELNRARKQLKELKERAKGDHERLSETVPAMKGSRSFENLLTTAPATVQQSLEGILKKLHDKRVAGERPDDIDNMSTEQLQDEKLAVQKTLLQHESVFGRPTTKKDKDIMRPLYDRYRLIKRRISSGGEFASRSTPVGPRKSSDLEPIHEDAPLESPQGASRALSQSLPVGGIKEGKQEPKKVARPLPKLRAEEDEDFDDTVKLEDTLTLTKTDSNTSREDAKFHEMSVEELREQLEIATKEKKKLRKKLKKFEDDFFEQSGRRIQKDERGEMADDYHQYKEIKHRLRLTEALLVKAQASQTI